LVGYSNSGKTTVMVGLIQILKARGYKVAVLKHAAHGYTIDPPGTDTWHYAEAGADQVVIAGPQSCTLHEFYQEEKSLAQIMERIQGVDIVLVEGYKREPGPKIEIYRHDYSPARILGIDQLLAIVSDVTVPDNIPRFSFSHLENLADFVVQYIIGL
jgi:molybdopterin-guanine dinucleotide biosynthesis protein MobB